jgi:hypothetical protein
MIDNVAFFPRLFESPFISMHARSNFQIRIPERSIAQTETKLEAGRYIVLPVGWIKKILFSQQATAVEEPKLTASKWR